MIRLTRVFVQCATGSNELCATHLASLPIIPRDTHVAEWWRCSFFPAALDATPLRTPPAASCRSGGACAAGATRCCVCFSCCRICSRYPRTCSRGTCR